MSTTVDASPAGFSTLLRERTAPDHGSAEQSPVMTALVEGTIELPLLGRLLAQHLLVYRALEATGAALADDPVVAPFLIPGLARAEVLEADVRKVLGDDALDGLTAGPGTAEYVDRIEATTDWPGGFVAHHYTRYMGDLSGGQIIGRVVARAHPEVSIGFYTFEAIDSPKAVKDRYRALLDAAPWPTDEQERIIAEVQAAYELNERMFADLEA